MAPVEIERTPSYIPLALAISRATAAAYASYTVGRSLYRAHGALGPAQDTRRRAPQRVKLTAVFGSLAALALVLAVSSSISYLTLSYKVWASERGIQVPNSLVDVQIPSRTSTNATSLHLARWLSDTPVYLDALEIVAEKDRRLWWGQQQELATIAWMALLAVEGRRRRIPHLWAYALLPHLVSLSFAQNLFYVALLQTPSPLPSQETKLTRVLRRILPRKPDNWFPKLPVLLAPLVFNYGVLSWLPYAAGTSWFPTAVALTKLLTLAPLVLSALAPVSWGTVSQEPHDAYGSITRLFNVISAASALLHAKTTVTSLLYNLPGSYKHRHSIKIPFDTEKRSQWERTATAVERVLGAMADHPAVAAAGKDVLLCALGIGLWAAVRAIDVAGMLRSVAVPAHHKLVAPPPRTPEARAQPGRVAVKAEPDSRGEEESPKPAVPPLSMTLRRRGRAAKTSAPGEPDNETPQPQPRRRGRPRKAKLEPEPEPEPEEAAGNNKKEDDDDKTYEPPPAVRAAAGYGDVMPEGDEFDWEPASLAWGLTALLGLGVGSAAVYGAECMSR